jgi:hypothetical protein
MFKVVSGSNAPFRTWMNVDTLTSTNLYVGQLVKTHSTSFDGAAPLAVAAGVEDATNDKIISGVVVGTNDLTPTYVASYGQYISSTTAMTQALQTARRQFGAFGNQSKGDPVPKVLVEMITAESVLRANLYNATIGIAPTLLTATAVNGTAGLGFTCNTGDVTPVQGMTTFYCRKGANAGLYRVCYTAHATVHTFKAYWPFTLAVGDQFVAVPYKQRGRSAAQINSTAGYIGMFFDVSQTPATDYFGIEVLEMDLSEAGKEHLIFRFSPGHFMGVD